MFQQQQHGSIAITTIIRRVEIMVKLGREKKQEYNSDSNHSTTSRRLQN
jgi:hypothetical protein